MATPKAFTTAPVGEEKTVRFTVDGVELVAKMPKSTSILRLAEQDEQNEMAQLKAALDFMRSAVDEDSWEYLHARLMDDDDAFDLIDIVPIMNWLTEEFLERPTLPSSASRGRRKPTGKRSTGPVRSAG